MDLGDLKGRAGTLARKARSAYLSEGLPGVLRRSRNWYHRKRTPSQVPRLPGLEISQPQLWPMSVLCVAERSLPQCYHYRVDQKRQMLRSLGVSFADCDQHNHDEILSRLQLSRLLIVYRLPGSDSLDAIVDEAHRLRIPVVYEVDDLVYDPDRVAHNPNMDSLPGSLRSAVIRGARGYLAALPLADVNLAATAELAQDMHSRNDKPAFVVENGIDDQMLEIASSLAGDPSGGSDEVVVTYGSGSRAHDHDFAVAAPALARWLRETPNGRLKIIGPVGLTDELNAMDSQILRIEQPLDYADYLRELSDSTISLAPLADEPFNRYKSHVKYLESALLGVPLVASPTVYADYVLDGKTGLIAADEKQWYTAITSLADDAGLRTQIAEDAREHVRRWELRNEPTRQMTAVLSDVCGWAPAA